MNARTNEASDYMAPDRETTAAAVSVLQAELSLANDNLDSLDNKATLLPGFLVALAALVVQPPMGHPLASTFLTLAIGFGAVSAVIAFNEAIASQVGLGPEASKIASNVTLHVADFNWGAAVALAKSVESATQLSYEKARKLRTAMELAGCTILFLVLSRVF